ncbi:MAG: UDP-N-acetylmuramoyl-L-alanine--D-glutamate ligase [Alphaproteobacteria bacterium]|nr:UDP-N-acetylmuramoyl-L-alanine--D-glutamate ligase [Alphaproteobacteria bacterium]
MIIPFTMSEQSIAILGLSRSGQAAVKALVAAGAKVFAHDDRDIPLLDDVVSVMPPEKWPWDQLDALVISPGIPHLHPKPHPAAEMARAHHIEIISDIELLMRAQPQAKLVGITGTNGKSTVVTLIDHLLKSNGVATALGGNIGRSALDLDDPGKDGVIILELSSYQLETTPSLSLDAGAVINITPDHLDRHGGWDGYVAAKANLVKAVQSHGLTVLGADGAVVQLAEQAASRLVIADQDMAPNTASSPDLKGPHNALNTAIAIEICQYLGVDRNALIAALPHYRGLPHRMEKVGQMGDIRFINDSKATNGDAAAEALKSFHDIYWIAGGDAKDGGIGVAANHLDQVRRAYLIGASAEAFAALIAAACPVEISGTLDRATASALHDAQMDRCLSATILLSPAAASFDQFKNFEDRGHVFRQIVDGLTAPAEMEAAHD